MAFSLPPLPQYGALIEPSTGYPTTMFQIYWQQVLDAIASEENNQNAVLDRIRRINSHTNPTTILHARDDGSSASITIDNHTRVFGDGTSLSIAGATVSGLASATSYAGYYDDTTLANESPAFLFTTDIATAQTVAADGRFFLGVIQTPAAGSGQTIDGGGVYPAGSNVGGELD